MATIQQKYVLIAEAFAYSKEQMALAAGSLGTGTYNTNKDGATKVVADVTTTTFDSGGNSSNLDEVQFEIELLASVNSAYLSTLNLANSSSTYLTAVRALNDYIVKYVLGTVVASLTLDDFIHTDCDDVWTDGVPPEWIELCTNAGFNVTAS